MINRTYSPILSSSFFPSVTFPIRCNHSAHTVYPSYTLLNGLIESQFLDCIACLPFARKVNVNNLYRLRFHYTCLNTLMPTITDCASHLRARFWQTKRNARHILTPFIPSVMAKVEHKQTHASTSFA